MDSGALTTIMRSTFASPPVSNNSGTSTIDEPPSSGRRALQKPTARLSHCGMHQPFEALQRLRVAQHPRSKALPIDLARDHDARKRRLDRLRALAGVEVAHGVIGVECRDAELSEHGRDCGFPHRDRARQADDDHCAASCVALTSASTSARSAGVTIRLPAEPAREGGRRLVEQHAQPLHGRQSARARGFDERGAQRNIDRVGDHRALRQEADIDRKRRLPDHA